MPFQIGRGAVTLPSDDEIHRRRAEFEAGHFVRIAGFVSADLLQWIRRELRAAPFHWEIHDDTDPPAKNLQLGDAQLQLKLCTLVNDSRLFGTVERMTGCAPIGCCLTHVYCLDAAPESRDAWHGDVDGNRLIAISINVGDAYSGGRLLIREQAGGRIVSEVDNPVAGSAVLFRIRGDLEHFVTPITAGRRLALAGWFQREPRARDLLRLSRARESLIPNP